MNRLQSTSLDFRSASPRPEKEPKFPTSASTLRSFQEERKNIKISSKGDSPGEETPVPFPRPVLGERPNAVGESNGIVADYKVPLKRTSPSPPGFGGKENGEYARPPPSQSVQAIPSGDCNDQQPTQAKPLAPKTTYVSVR
jgi:hypothetical protein